MLVPGCLALEILAGRLTQIRLGERLASEGRKTIHHKDTEDTKKKKNSRKAFPFRRSLLLKIRLSNQEHE
jgi:hypothetical protein